MARKPVFTKLEETILQGEYQKRQTVLEGKFSTTITLAGKRKAWQEIADVLNR